MIVDGHKVEEHQIIAVDDDFKLHMIRTNPDGHMFMTTSGALDVCIGTLETRALNSATDSVAITTAAPLDVNVQGTVPISSGSTLDVSVQGTVPISSGATLDVDVQNTVTVQATALDVRTLNTATDSVTALMTQAGPINVNISSTNIDIRPLQSSVDSVSVSGMIDNNIAVASIDGKLRVGAEQSLDPALFPLQQNLVYGLHEGHGGGADDLHPIAVNENGHLFATVETNGVPLDVSIVSSGILDVCLTNQIVPVGIIGQDGPVEISGNVYDGQLSAKIDTLNAKLDTINNSLNRNVTSVYIYDGDNTSKVAFAAPCKLYSIYYGMSDSTSGTVALYDVSGSASSGDPYKLAFHLKGSNTGSIDFGPNGMSFIHGIVYRGVTGIDPDGTSDLGINHGITLLIDPS